MRKVKTPRTPACQRAKSIRSVRFNLGMTRAELAELAECDITHIRRAEVIGFSGKYTSEYLIDLMLATKLQAQLNKQGDSNEQEAN